MSETIGFKVTVEYICPNMIDKDSLINEYNNDYMEAYKDISDDFRDSVINFYSTEKIIKVEAINKNNE